MSVVISDTSPVDSDRVGGYLVPVGTTVTATSVYASPHSVDAIIAKVERQALAAAHGLTTDKAGGRAEIKSVAHRVARTKTALDDLGKELVADWKAKSAAVDTQRRRIREALDAIKDAVRRPLTEWEIEEEGRQVRISLKLQGLRSLLVPATASSDTIAAKLQTAQATAIEGFEERTAEATQLKADIVGQLEHAHATAVERERVEAAAAAAEAERQRLATEAAEAKAKIDALEAALKQAVEASAPPADATAQAPAATPEPTPAPAPTTGRALLTAAQLRELREWADGLVIRYPAKGELLQRAIAEIDYWRAAQLLRA
jgi:hypothetical protein